MHEVVKRELQDSFDIIQFDNLDWNGVASDYTEEHIDELIDQCNDLVSTFERDEILALKCGELFTANEINNVLIKLLPIFLIRDLL